MRILYYSTADVTRENGAVRRTVAIAHQLGRAGHRVLLVTAAPRVELRGCFRRLSLPAVHFYIQHLGIGAALRVLLLQVVARLWGADCLYHRSGYEMVPVIAADRIRLPRVCELVEWLPPGQFSSYEDPATPGQDLEALRAHVAQARAVVSATAADARRARNLLGVPADRVVEVPNGFDPALFGRADRARARHHLGWAPGEFIVGHVGSFARYEDTGTLVKAVALARDRIPGIRLVMIGALVPARDPARRAAEVGLPDGTLVLTGAVPHERVDEYLAAADVAVIALTRGRLQSNRGCEATRLSEYWASGACVLAADLPGSDTYQHHRAGRLMAVPPGDPRALADALVTLGRQPALRARVRANGQHYAVANRTWPELAGRVSALITRTVGAGNGGGA